MSSLKGLISESGHKALQAAREACGGLGFSAYSGLGERMNDHDVQQTWEGDNTVLTQQTAKFLLDSAKRLFQGKELKDAEFCRDWMSVMPVSEERFEEFDELPSCESLIKAL